MIKRYHDETYLELVKHILDNGVQKGDRTGTGTISVFGYQMRFDLSNNIIPVLTTKKMHLRSILHEIIWYMAGDTNIKYLNDNGVRIWNEWADKNGDLGPVYGAMWRNWGGTTQFVYTGDTLNEMVYERQSVGGIDQIAEALDQIKNNPNSRRIVVTGWDPRTVPDPELSFDENVANGKQALPPCHMMFQFYVANGKLSCQLYQRSCDVGLGVPFNIAQYSIMTLMMAKCAGLEPGEFIWVGGDCHIYNNHIEQLTEQLTRKPFQSPHLVLPNFVENMEDFTFDDIDGIIGYDSYDTLKMDVSI